MALDSDALDFTAVLDQLPKAERYEQPEKDAELSTLLQSHLDEAQSRQSSWQRSIDFYRRYLEGDQLIVHRTTGEIIRLNSEDSKRLRSVNNVLRPTSRSLVGKLTRQIPSVDVTPPSNDFEDTHGAQMGHLLLQYHRRKENLDLVYQEACEYLPWAGNAILQCCWDRLAGPTKAWCAVCDFTDEEALVGSLCPNCEMQRMQEKAFQEAEFENQSETALQEVAASLPPGVEPDASMVPDEAVNEPELQQSGPLPPEEEPPTLFAVKAGDVKAYCRDVRYFYVSPGATSLLNAQWVLYRSPEPVANLRAEFPEMAMFIDSDISVRVDGQESAWYVDEDTLKDHAWREEWHEKPSEAYPNGRIIWRINGNIVKEEESPYYTKLGRFPFYHFVWDKNAGKFFAEAYISQAWHRQREINSCETSVREAVELLLKKKLLVPIGSRITADEIAAYTAQIIHYNASAGEVKDIDFGPIPPDLFNRGVQLAADIRQQAGITDQEAGMGSSDPNGRAMAILNAEADQQLGPILRRNNGEWREFYRALLVITQAKYGPERLVVVTGPDSTEAFTFSEMNLKPGWDIVLEEVDSLSTNKAVRFQQAMDLVGTGYFADPATGALDKKLFARKAGLQDPEKGYDVEATERAAARQIPYKLMRNEQFQPHYFDDPKIFAETLIGWLRGPGRRADPSLAQQVEQVWMFYTQWAVSLEMGTGGGGMPPVPGQEASQPGTDQSAPGGSANNPGHIGAEQQGVGAEAQQTVQNADQTGEREARIQSKHEG